MELLLIILHVIVSLFLVAIVLLQHGKGADVGATFGGSSQSLFGSEGPVPLLNKITTFAAIIFMGTSVALAYVSANKSTKSVMSDIQVHEQSQTAASTETVTVPMPQEQETPASDTEATPAEKQKTE